MKVVLKIDEIEYCADLSTGIDISIAVGKIDEVSAYGIPKSEISIYKDGGFVGDVSSGGSCNVRNINMNPHGNGTHTECVGHVSKNYKTIYETISDFHFAATLISVNVEESIKAEDLAFLNELPRTKGLIIRTIPNTKAKLRANYSTETAVYIHPLAMQLINELEYEHLIVDLPSVDHATDPILQSHKIYWELEKDENSTKTITELVYIPNTVTDGMYLVNLMLPSIYCDAVPSKPILYSLR